MLTRSYAQEEHLSRCTVTISSVIRLLLLAQPAMLSAIRVIQYAERLIWISDGTQRELDRRLIPFIEPDELMLHRLICHFTHNVFLISV